MVSYIDLFAAGTQPYPWFLYLFDLILNLTSGLGHRELTPLSLSTPPHLPFQLHPTGTPSAIQRFSISAFLSFCFFHFFVPLKLSLSQVISLNSSHFSINLNFQRSSINTGNMAPPALPLSYRADRAFDQTPPPYQDLTSTPPKSAPASKRSPRELSPELGYYSVPSSFKFTPVNRAASTVSSSTLSLPPLPTSPTSSTCQKLEKTQEDMPPHVRAAEMTATDFQVVLRFHAANKQAYLIIRDDVVAYAIQHGITGVETPGPDAW